MYDDTCPICGGSGITTKPVEEPDGRGGYVTIYEDSPCDCQ